MNGEHGIETVEITPVQQLRALRRMFGLSGPSTHVLAAIARLTTAVRVAKGTIIQHEDKPFAMVYLLLEGEVRAMRSGKVIGVFGPRGTLGGLSTLARDRAGFTCEALSVTTALTLPAEDFLEVLEDHFELMYSALRALAREGIELRRKIMPHAGFVAPKRPGVACPAAPLDLAERILYLRETFGLRRSYIDELAQLARAAGERRYQAGERLWRAGDRANHAAILLCGAVDASTAAGARFTFGPGDIVGGLDTIAGEPRWFDAVVAEDIVALILDAEALVDVCEDRPGLGLDFLRMLATDVSGLRERRWEGDGGAAQAQLEGEAAP